MKSEHTRMWIILIKLKCFCWEETLFLGSFRKRKEHRKLAEFLLQNKIINELGNYILKIMLRLCLCKQTNICRVFNYISVWEKYIWNWSKINQLIKSIIHCQTVPMECLGTYVCSENCMSGFSAFVLNLSTSGIFLFRSMANGNCLLSSVSAFIGRR